MTLNSKIIHNRDISNSKAILNKQTHTTKEMISMLPT